MNAPSGDEQKSPQQKPHPGLEMMGLIPSQPRQQPPPPSTAHLDPYVCRSMTAIEKRAREHKS